MELEYYKVDERYQRVKLFGCPNNEGVMCTMKNCYCCGWNPTIAKKRLEKILKEGRTEMDKNCTKCIHKAVCKTAESCDGYVSGCKHFIEKSI